jgi:hypothetical protein
LLDLLGEVLTPTPAPTPKAPAPSPASELDVWRKAQLGVAPLKPKKK